MINKHGNWKYNGGVPFSVGDRYYSQDKIRDFRYAIDSIGRAFSSVHGGSAPWIVSGGIVTKGSGNTLNITGCKGYAKFSVDVPDSFASIPPTKTALTIEAVPVESTAQTNMAIPSAVLDNVTTNYIKVRFLEADGSTRLRQRAGGTYSYEMTESFEIIVNTTAPTSEDICLGEFISISGSVPTIFNYTNRSPQMQTSGSNPVTATIISAQTETDYGLPLFLSVNSSGQVTLSASSTYPFIARFPMGKNAQGEFIHAITKIETDKTPTGWAVGAIGTDNVANLYVTYGGDGNMEFGFDESTSSDIKTMNFPVDEDKDINHCHGNKYCTATNRTMTDVGFSYTPDNRLYVGTIRKYYWQAAIQYEPRHNAFSIIDSRKKCLRIEQTNSPLRFQKLNITPGEGYSHYAIYPSMTDCTVSLPYDANYCPGHEVIIEYDCTHALVGGRVGASIRIPTRLSFEGISGVANLVLSSVGDYVHLLAGSTSLDGPHWHVIGARMSMTTGWINISNYLNRQLGMAYVPIGVITNGPSATPPQLGELFVESTSGNYGRLYKFQSGSNMYFKNVTGTGIFTSGRTLTGTISGATCVVSSNSKNVDSLMYSPYMYMDVQRGDIPDHDVKLFYNSSASVSGMIQLNACDFGSNYGVQSIFQNGYIITKTGSAGCYYLNASTGVPAALTTNDTYYMMAIKVTL